jgi:hypothetical protein
LLNINNNIILHQKVYFGTSRGQMKVLDIHGAPVYQVNLSNVSGITSMSWSCEKFCMNENKIKSDRECN